MKPLHVPEVGDAWHQAMMAGRRSEGWGVARPCLGCGRTAYSAGQHCLGCEANQEGWDREVGAARPVFRPCAAAEVADRVELIPAQTCEVDCEHAIPGPVDQLDDHARTYGWQAMVRHSRGGVMGGSGKQLAVAEMWSVRFRRGQLQGYAVRRGGDWSSVCVAGVDLPPFLAMGVTELREWLAAASPPGPAWYGEILLRRDVAARAAKIVACPGSAACEWVKEGRGLHTHRGDGSIRVKAEGKAKEHGN